MRRLERNLVPGEGNALRVWHRLRNPARLLSNYLLAGCVKRLPSLTLKELAAKAMGVRAGRGVSFGQDVQLDFFFPELIEIGDNAIIGFGATILSHEFTQHEWRKGVVHIGKDVLVGANATILPGVAIGDGATIGAGAVVTKDVPAGAFATGVPATPRPVRKGRQTR